MADYLNITDFLSPVDIREISCNETYKDGQFGNIISIYHEQFPDLDDAQIVLVGCGEQRGSGLIHGQSKAPDIIRRHFYSLFSWHHDIIIADVGNIKTGLIIAGMISNKGQTVFRDDCQECILNIFDNLYFSD